MNFEGFSGNERAKEYLNSAFARNSLPHALILAGERGIGKKTLAGIVAQSLVCENGDNSPCGVCAACYKAKNGFHPDIIFLDAQNIKADAKKYGIEPKKDSVIDVIRAVKSNALLRPNDAERKVYIIDNAGNLSHECQDALLKILEEPPHFTFFILLCYNYSDLLTTIVSRAAHITLSPLSDEDVMKIIREKKPSLSDAEASEIVRTCGGVCSFLVEDKNTELSETAASIAKALISRDELEIFTVLNKLEKADKTNLSWILDELILIIRDALIISTGAESRRISPAEPNIPEAFARAFSSSTCNALIKLTSEAQKLCVRNVGTGHIIGSLICKFAHTVA